MNPNVSIPARDSIAIQLFKTVFTVYVILGITVTAIHLVAEYHYAKDLVFNELQVLHTAVKPNIAMALDSQDRKQMQATLENLMQFPSVTGIEVMDEKKVVNMTIGRTPKNSHTFPVTVFEVFELSRPLSAEGQGHPDQLGSLTLYSDSSVILHRMQVEIGFIVVNAMIKTAVVWGLFLILARRLLAEPLSAIAGSLKHLDPENLKETKIEPSNQERNELKVIEDEFNTMVGKFILSREQLITGQLRLGLLLEGMRELASARDKFHAMLLTVNILMKAVPLSPPTRVHFSFQETAGNSEGYATFEMPLTLSEDQSYAFSPFNLGEVTHTFSIAPPTYLQASQEHGQRTGCEFRDNALQLVAWRRNNLQGGILIREMEEATFRKFNAQFLDTLSASLAIALENVEIAMQLEKNVIRRTKALEEALAQLQDQNRQMVNDLEMASKVQKAILPTPHLPVFIDLALWFQPLAPVSGDIYFFADHSDTFDVFLGDATGHGVAAAFLTVMVNMVLLEEASKTSLSEIMECLNKKLKDNTPSYFFMTGVYLRIHENGLMQMVNAGHLPVVVMSSQVREPQFIRTPGPLMGFGDYSAEHFPEHVYTLQKGDKVLIFTDGLQERANSHHAMFGKAQLQNSLQEYPSLNSAELLNLIVEDWRAFAQEIPSEDDTSIIVLEYK